MVGAAAAACGSSCSSSSCSAAAATAITTAAVTTAAVTTAAAAEAAEFTPGRGGEVLRARFHPLADKKFCGKRGQANQNILQFPPKGCIIISSAGPTVSWKKQRGTGGFCRVSGLAGCTSRGPAAERAKHTPGRAAQQVIREVENLHEQISQTICAWRAGPTRKADFQSGNCEDAAAL